MHFTVNSNKDARGDRRNDRRRREPGELSEAISAEGGQIEGLAAAEKILLWNMVYDSVNGRVVTPVSRNWCKRGEGSGDYVLFEWDTFFAAMQYGLIDKDLAYCTTVFNAGGNHSRKGGIPNLRFVIGM